MKKKSSAMKWVEDFVSDYEKNKTSFWEGWKGKMKVRTTLSINITTKDLSVSDRYKKLKKELNVDHEDIYIEGLKGFEKKLDNSK